MQRLRPNSKEDDGGIRVKGRGAAKIRTERGRVTGAWGTGRRRRYRGGKRSRTAIFSTLNSQASRASQQVLFCCTRALGVPCPVAHRGTDSLSAHVLVVRVSTCTCPSTSVIMPAWWTVISSRLQYQKDPRMLILPNQHEQHPAVPQPTVY